MCSQSATVALKKVFIPARARLAGGALSLPTNIGWTCKDVNIDDPAEVALAGRLQISALTHLPGPLSVHMLVHGMRVFFGAAL